MKPILLLVFSAVLRFPAILTVAQPDIGAIAGQTASWTFQASADPAVYLTFTDSFLLFETNPSIGTYMDSIGAWGGPVNFALPPASGIWSDVLGSFSIDALAAIGAKNDATLRVLFETHSGDLPTCDSCFVSSGWEDVTVSVTVAQTPTPEPASMLLFAAAGALAAFYRRRLVKVRSAWRTNIASRDIV